jgi:kumamolisin
LALHGTHNNIMLRRRFWQVSLLMLVCLGFAQAQSFRGNSDILVPDSGRESGQDIGVRAHTNYLLRSSFLNSFPASAGPAPLSLPGGYSPQEIRRAYGLPASGGSGVICVVDAFDYPTALHDFNLFSKTFGLPEETSANPTNPNNKVLQVVYATGSRPPGNVGWGGESSLDIQWAHALAPNAKIVLVESYNDTFAELFNAVRVASRVVGCRQVSMSWSGSQFGGETAYDVNFTAPNVVYFASAGDSGAAADYPPSSPRVVAVGGTTLKLDSLGRRLSETGWTDSGGGLSSYEPRPFYQNSLSGKLLRRGVPDIALVADPYTGVANYDTYGSTGWYVVGGTSLSAPAVAAIFNVTGHFFSGSATALSWLYSRVGTSLYNDIVSGSNGLPCVIGWDFVTGVGTWKGLQQPLISRWTVSPSPLVGGGSLYLRVDLDRSSSTAQTVEVTNPRPDLIETPASITIPAGALGKTLLVKTHGVAIATGITLQSIFGSTKLATRCVLNPAALKWISAGSATIVGGIDIVATVQLDGQAPTGGATVALSSSNSALVAVPAHVVVPAGSSSVQIRLHTVAPSAASAVQISAAYGALSKSMSITLEPR